MLLRSRPEKPASVRRPPVQHQVPSGVAIVAASAGLHCRRTDAGRRPPPEARPFPFQHRAPFHLAIVAASVGFHCRRAGGGGLGGRFSCQIVVPWVR
jgi:hypothetical protein